MSLCPENEFRSNLSDKEFWAYVCQIGPEFDDIPDEDEYSPVINVPCSVCGSNGACAYDAEGNPMIHSESEEDE